MVGEKKLKRKFFALRSIFEWPSLRFRVHLRVHFIESPIPLQPHCTQDLRVLFVSSPFPLRVLSVYALFPLRIHSVAWSLRSQYHAIPRPMLLCCVVAALPEPIPYQTLPPTKVAACNNQARADSFGTHPKSISAPQSKSGSRRRVFKRVGSGGQAHNVVLVRAWKSIHGVLPKPSQSL
jgi:hypothetical protein